MPDFGVGILGATGYVATPYRAEIRQTPADARIVALCARRRDLLDKAGREDKSALITDDWRQVVEHPDVNVVLVATPDALHHEAVMACAAAEKHVICEKPVGMNATEAFEMWSAYRDRGLGHFVPFWTRYVPVFQRAREIVQAGTLGEIRAVIYRWHNPRPPGTPFTWRDDAKLSAAGSLADVGSHAYDAIRWMLGQEAARVLTHADVITPEKPDLGAINLEEALRWGGSHAATESSQRRLGTAFDFADVAFVLESGAVGSLILSHAPFLRKGLAPELELHGTEASLSLDRINAQLMLARAVNPPELLETVPDPGFRNRFARYAFPALRARIACEPTEHPGLDDGHAVQRFIDACVRSVRQGGWVTLAGDASVSIEARRSAN